MIKRSVILLVMCFSCKSTFKAINLEWDFSDYSILYEMVANEIVGNLTVDGDTIEPNTFYPVDKVYLKINKENDIIKFLLIRKNLIGRWQPIKGQMNKFGQLSNSYENSVHNLLLLLLNLPDFKVEVGDSWEIEIDLMEDLKFGVIDSSFNKNNVSLNSIDSNMAQVKYDIKEYKRYLVNQETLEAYYRIKGESSFNIKEKYLNNANYTFSIYGKNIFDGTLDLNISLKKIEETPEVLRIFESLGN